MPDHLANMIDFPDVRIYHQKPGKVGVYKSKKTTENYRWVMTMCMIQDKISFDEELFTCSKDHTPKTIKNFFRVQMERYRYERKTPSDPVFGNNNVKKLTGKGSGMEDDLLITVMMGPVFLREIMKNPRLRGEIFGT